MFVTADVSQAPMGWLNDEALKNMLPILVTADVFHDRMSSLNEVFPENNPDISVTWDTFQVAISPYFIIKSALSLARRVTLALPKLQAAPLGFPWILWPEKPTAPICQVSGYVFGASGPAPSSYSFSHALTAASSSSLFLKATCAEEVVISSSGHDRMTGDGPGMFQVCRVSGPAYCNAGTLLFKLQWSDCIILPGFWYSQAAHLCCQTNPEKSSISLTAHVLTCLKPKISLSSKYAFSDPTLWCRFDPKWSSFRKVHLSPVFHVAARMALASLTHG